MKFVSLSFGTPMARNMFVTRARQRAFKLQPSFARTRRDDFF